MKTLKKESKILVFRVDASTQMGTGHAMRCLALAQAWQANGGEVYFCTHHNFPIALAQRLAVEGMTRIEIQSTPGSLADALATIAHCQECNSRWLILDGYHFNADYQRTIKAAQLRLLVIDDYGHADSYYADFILNQNVYANADLYPRISSQTQLLLGCKYALLRREFWSWRNDTRFKTQKLTPNSPLRILITLGGSDPDNISLTVLKALKCIDLDRTVAKVVVGVSNPHLDLLKSVCADLGESVSLYFNVKNIPKLMSQSDLAISAGGSTCWELAFMGIPSLLLILAENQRFNVERLGALNVGINLGWHQQVTPQIIAFEISQLCECPDRLNIMSKIALKLVDGFGSDRVLMSIQNMKLRLREASISDGELLWKWVNDPAVRTSAFSSEPIHWNEHIQWLNHKLQDSNSHIFIAFDLQDQPIGQIRFDIKENQYVEIDISLDRNWRGIGYGKLLIEAAVDRIFNTMPVKTIYALIKSNNCPSIKSFEKAGFKKKCEETVLNDSVTHYVLTRSDYIAEYA
jgi:UDP-2,4-diacetamido-2,4,6-trideoxy-beta-L-altropyranose hydrolase